MKRALPILLIITALTISSCGFIRNPLGTASRTIQSAPYRAKGLVHQTKGTLRTAAMSASHLSGRAAATTAKGAAIAAPVARTVATGGF